MRPQSGPPDPFSLTLYVLLAAIGEEVRTVVREELARAAHEVPPALTDELLDTRAAIRFTGRSASTLRRWRALGLTAVQTEAGGKLTYQRAELIQFMHSRSSRRATSSRQT